MFTLTKANTLIFETILRGSCHLVSQTPFSNTWIKWFICHPSMTTTLQKLEITSQLTDVFKYLR